MAKSTVSPKSSLGHGWAAGLAFLPVAFLFSVWIPTLALVFGAGTVVAGVLDLRGASGRRRRVAILTIGLGVATIGLLVLVVVLSSGSSTGHAVVSIPPPG